jgi:hypothetical protein
MSRIKVRVSTGVSEVSLVRVVAKRGAVEVVWDRGLKREFRFSSVVLSESSDGLVGHKPTEIALVIACELPRRRWVSA